MPFTASQGSEQFPSSTVSREMPAMCLSMPARLPEIMVSLTAGPTLPSSIRKEFLATPENSPPVPAAPPPWA